MDNPGLQLDVHHDRHVLEVRTTPSQQWRSWWRALPTTEPVMADASLRGFVVTTRTAAELGVSRAQQRTAVRRGRWCAPAYGVVAPVDIVADDPSEFVLARRRHALVATAGVLKRPDHAVAGRSAAVLFGVPTRFVPRSAELAAPNPDGLGRQNPTHSYGATLYAYALTAWHGVPVTTPARTVVDLARHDCWDGIMAADAVLRDGLARRDELELELADARGWPGVRTARTIVALADDQAESALESVVRLAVHRAGFPPPRLQQWIGQDRVDFLWPERRLVLEADGREKYLIRSGDADALWAEKQRENRLRRAGFHVVRVLWADVFAGWPRTEQILRSYF